MSGVGIRRINGLRRLRLCELHLAVGLGIVATIFVPRRLAAQDYQPAIAEMISTIDGSMTKAAFKTVAVLGVTDLLGRPSCLGDLFAEEISVGLAGKNRAYEVVSRNDSKLKAALNEQKLGRSGLVDPQTAAKVGQLVGVQALAMGTVTFVGDNIRFTVSVIDSASARIIGGGASTIPRTKAIEEFLAGCGGSTAGATGEAGSPPVPTSPSVTVQGFQFELDACTRKGGAVTCAFWMTNQREDRSFFVGSGVGVVGFRAWDDRGNEYTGTRVQVANKVMDAMGVRLVANVRTRLVFSIEGSVAGAVLKRLQFSASGSDVGFFTVTIQELPLTDR